MRGRLKEALYDEADDGSLRRRYADPVTVGDQVVVTVVNGIEGAIEDLEPRRTRLSRIDTKPHPGAPDVEHVIVANIDRVFVIVSIRKPRVNFRFVDRLLIMAQFGGVEPVVVVNKCDLLQPPERAELDQTMATVYEPIGVRWVATSAETGEGIDSLRNALSSGMNAFVGMSGTGKSSLLNRLDPSLALRTEAISEWSGKGRHTTTYVELLELEGGVQVADTPGIREAGLWGVPDGLLDSYFVEMIPYIGKCRFRNCWHLAEPDCAVRDAVKAGDIPAQRYASYRRLCGEGPTR